MLKEEAANKVVTDGRNWVGDVMHKGYSQDGVVRATKGHRFFYVFGIVAGE